MNASIHALVALDPSSDWGEAALEFASRPDGAGAERVTLLVALTGPTAHALREYAAAEGISVAEAGEVYLEQVIDRLQARDVDADGVTAVGNDIAAELVEAARSTGAELICVPAGGRIVAPKAIEPLAEAAGIPLAVVPVGRRTAA
jgi:nucleotide-binding universal stress UspA family protein